MSWKLHTPEGTGDILTAEYDLKSRTIRAIQTVFCGFGYQQVQTPVLEFYDVFSAGAAKIDQQTMFKFFDEEGRIVVLRPDMTTPVARMVATKLKDAPRPLRLCYTGSTFRNERGLNGDKQREFTQSGVELLGESSPEADAEVIAITISCLRAVGRIDFQIDIGQVEFFKGLAEQIGLNQEETEKLRAMVDVKNSLAIKELVEAYDAPDRVKQIAVSLPSLFGDEALLDEIDTGCLNERPKAALRYLKEVIGILKDYGMDDVICIDLGMVQSLNYYTGVIFKGFTRTVGYPVCGGGRYDKLCGEFGEPCAATGVSIGIDRLVNALLRSGAPTGCKAADYLVCWNAGCRKKAFDVCTRYRNEGKVVLCYLGDGETNGAVQYAKTRGIPAVISVSNDNIAFVYTSMEVQK